MSKLTRIPCSIDIVLFRLGEKSLEVLLMQRAPREMDKEPFPKQWALVGGTVDAEVDVDLLDAAHRILKRRTGLVIDHLEQVLTEGSRTRDTRGWTMTTVYMGLVGPEYGVVMQKSKDILDLAWVPIGNATVRALAYDHTKLFHLTLERFRAKMAYSLLPAYLLPREFTLNQMQSVYERVLDTTWDPKTFRDKKDLMSAIEPVGDKKAKTGGRRAQLYRLKETDKQMYLRRSLVFQPEFHSSAE